MLSKFGSVSSSGTLYLTSMWSGVDLKGTPKHMCWKKRKEKGLCAHNLLNGLGPILNIVRGAYMIIFFKYLISPLELNKISI